VTEKNENIVVWNLQAPKALDEAIEKLIKRNFHVTKAEFIRDAVRRRLEELGVKPEG